MYKKRNEKLSSRDLAADDIRSIEHLSSMQRVFEDFPREKERVISTSSNLFCSFLFFIYSRLQLVGGCRNTRKKKKYTRSQNIGNKSGSIYRTFFLKR